MERTAAGHSTGTGGLKENPHSPNPKATDNTSEIANLFLRKKICQKLAKLLQRSYSIDKEKAQELTLYIEDKLNGFYQANVNEYKHSIKALHKLIKVNLSLNGLI